MGIDGFYQFHRVRADQITRRKNMKTGTLLLLSVFAVSATITAVETAYAQGMQNSMRPGMVQGGTDQQPADHGMMQGGMGQGMMCPMMGSGMVQGGMMGSGMMGS